MAKAKTRYFCSQCGQETSGWRGRCPGCGAWNTLVEEIVQPQPPGQSSTRSWLAGLGLPGDHAATIRLADVAADNRQRLPSGIGELDRVLGGGFVRGSLVLIGGDPGIGKSTLLLQVLGRISKKSRSLYISGEESPQQVRLRADRLAIEAGEISLLASTDFATVAEALATQKPDLAVVDSIQTLDVAELSAAPGSVSQVREAAAGLLRLAKAHNITIVLVGHVTKDGSIAGPRVLEHMVDTVLYFEGDNQQSYRILRAVKNRFGATDEIGIFEMSDHGLLEVDNASQAMLSGRPLQVAGSVVTACLEGTRPLLVEIQALLNESAYGAPQRMAQGLDRNRVTMLLAVLDKHFRFGMNNLDTYVSVVGGVRLAETAADLAIASAVISSLKNKPVQPATLMFGEIGLTGEIRSIAQADRRIGEGSRLGFSRFILPGSCRTALAKAHLPDDVDLIYVDRVAEAVDILF
jgi:DNA repair protein RadA/Sms